MNISLLKELEKYDTPTVCNALEMIDKNRKNFGYTKESFFCLRPNMHPVVGVAKTATMRSFGASDKSADELKQERVKYYGYVYEGDYPKILILQDLDGAHRGHGPFFGEFNTRVHKFLGCTGVVTDSSIRDYQNLPDGIQILSAGLKPSHGNVHIVNYNTQVNVNGMVVTPGQIIHADIHGAVAFSADLMEQVIANAKLFMADEEPVISACKDSENLTFDKLIEIYMGRK